MDKPELLLLANEAYEGADPAGEPIDLDRFYDAENDHLDSLDVLGDGLLAFVLIELAETFDTSILTLERHRPGGLESSEGGIA